MASVWDGLTFSVRVCVRLAFFCALACTSYVENRALAAGPTPTTRTITFKGYATDAGGTPLNGTQNVVFRIVDHPSSATPPANELWRESWDGTNVAPLMFENGVFEANLGNA